jgi:hypothetical protein
MPSPPPSLSSSTSPLASPTSPTPASFLMGNGVLQAETACEDPAGTSVLLVSRMFQAELGSQTLFFFSCGGVLPRRRPSFPPLALPCGPPSPLLGSRRLLLTSPLPARFPILLRYIHSPPASARP